MSISERIYIRWPPEEASEPTSTLVLTAPNRQFVDLRLVTSAEDSSTSPYTALDWGIGGRSIGTPTHGVWTHDIDSRTERPEDLDPDEGDMFPHPELGPDVTLERGRMRNPERGGQVAEYEEAWRDVPVLAVGGDSRCVSVVLELGGPTATAPPGSDGRRGLVCRLGQYCQGIVRADSEVTVERWEWSAAGSNDGGGRWKRVARLGEGRVPCDATWRDGGLVEGDTVDCDGSSWTVKAVHVW